MADKETFEVSGLQLSNNTFSASPPGSLLLAENCVMPQKGVIQPRRGQDRAFVAPSSTQFTFAMTEFQDSLIINSATAKTSTNYTLGIAGNPTADFSTGPWNPVDTDGSSTSAPRMKFGFAGSFMHFCTTTGPKTLESVSDNPRAAGLLRMPDPIAAPISAAAISGSTGWLPYGSSVAYRSVLRKPVADGTSLLSPPSGRYVASNVIMAAPGGMVRTGGTTVDVTITGLSALGLGLEVGDSVTISPGEANFAAGTEVVTSVSGNVFEYADAGANVSNTLTQSFNTGARCVRLYVPLSSDATTETPLRIYRSLYTSSATVEPSDEMFLVAEVFLSSGDITAGYILYDDVTPQSVINDPLYTNPLTGEGATQANYQPPLYRDLSNWSGRTWYSNTTGLQTFRLQMLGVGTPDGIQVNDTITVTINATDYELTFVAAAGSSTEVSIADDDEPSVNILRTSTNLIAVFNALMASSGESVRAYYESAQDGSPGKILIQAIEYGLDAFGVKASRPATWAPALDTSTAVDSVAEYVPNGLAYSKLGQPEAVPLVNYLQVGSKNYPIARIAGLQQALLVFKEGDGIYAVTNSYPFQIQQISTANIIAPDACVVFADAAWVYTDQGILRVSDSGGATVVSRPIETELDELRILNPTATYDYSFAVANETQRRVYFFVPCDRNGASDGTNGLPTLRAWCYNNATQAWTGPLYTNAFSGIVAPSDDKLYLGVWDEPWNTTRVTRERTTGNLLANYGDADFSATITAVDVGGDPLVITLASVTDVEVGDAVIQFPNLTKVASIDGNNVTLFEEMDFIAGACTIEKGYTVTLQFQPMGTPTARKALTRLAWLFKPGWFETYTGKTLLMTDQVQADSEIDTTFVGFGLATTTGGGGFGVTQFGDPSPLTIDVNPMDPRWTNAAQFFPGFTATECFMKIKLQGFGLRLDEADAPVGRGK